MSFKQALQSAYTKANGLECIEALDMGDFWAFAFGKKNEMCGGGYVTVNKSDGELNTFNPIQNLELYRKAKPINI